MIETLAPLAEALAVELKARGQTVGVAESSSGGLISAALLAVPGASAYFQGGGVIYTAKARMALLGLRREDVAGVRSSSEPYAILLARTARENLGADWGLSETGAAGPTGNPYGDAAGHTCVAVSGPVEMAFTLETASSDRAANMQAFARAALQLLQQALG
jgi:nicotinamide-nucleotide amidase